MKANHANLFEPVKIGSVEIKNRYFMAPMGNFGLCDTEGALTERGVDYFVERAKGGTGLLITVICMVNEDIEELASPLVLSVHKNPIKFMRSSLDMTERAHAHGSKVFLQLASGFGRSGIPSFIKDKVAPSVAENRFDPSIEHRALTIEEIKKMIQNFVAGAVVAKKSGYDGVEIHAVHEGYLLDQFAISFWNKRTDEYGGSLENRLRFATDIVKGIKAACGADFPVSLRYSVKSYLKGLRQGGLPGEDFVELGRDTEEGLEAAKILVDAGYDSLNVDAGIYDSHYWNHPPVYFEDGMYLDLAEKVKEVVDVPVMVAGRMDNPDLGSDAVRNNRADMIGLGRPLLADPFLPRRS